MLRHFLDHLRDSSDGVPVDMVFGMLLIGANISQHLHE